MARPDPHTPPHSPPPSPPASPPSPSSQILIEIPTHEFTNLPSTPPRPHPQRPKAPLQQKLTSATLAREASLETLRHRCKHHVDHVVTVANTVKQRRQQKSSLHAQRLRDAEERRRHLLSGRAARLRERGEWRARVLRERRRKGTRMDGRRLRGVRANNGEQMEGDIERRAARKIAGYYLLNKARREMIEAGVLGEGITKYSFAQLTKRLEDEKAQRAVAGVFRALGMRKGNERREKAERRVLLSCLVVALHPEAVVEDKVRNGDGVDVEVVCAARRLLLCLQVGSLGAVAAAWMEWKRVFVVWKKSDRERLLKAMVEDAVATEGLRAAVDRRFAEVRNVDGFMTSLGVSETAAELHRKEQKVWMEQIAIKQRQTKEAVVKLAGEEGERQLEAALEAAKRVGDERIVHEILMDFDGLLKQIRDASRTEEGVWDQLRTELCETPMRKDELARRLAHISSGLNAMIDGCFEMDGQQVPEELDTEFAVSVVMRVKAALGKCQAQVFDDVVEEWSDGAVQRLRSAEHRLVDVVVDVLKEASELVHTVQRDVLAYRVRHSAPIVQQFGAAWERSHFQGHIMSGRFSKALPRTKRNFGDVLESLGNEGVEFRKQLKEKNPSAMRRLLVLTVVRLIMMKQMCTEEDLPEVMHLDLERIIHLQNECQRMALIASLDNVSRQVLSPRGVARNIADMDELIRTCRDDRSRLKDIQDAFLSFVGAAVRRTGQCLPSSEEDLLRTMVERVTRPGDRTFDLLHKRTGKCIIESALDNLRKRNHAFRNEPSSTSLRSPAAGLETVEEELLVVGKTVSSVVAHLLNVHSGSLTVAVQEL